MKSIASIFAFLLIGAAFAVPFERMRLGQDINTNVLNTLQEKMNSTNGTLVLRASSSYQGEIPYDRVNASNGITFDVYEDGEVKFFFDTQDDQRNPADRIFVNGKTLNQLIQEQIPENILDIVNQNNPLWKKKLVVLGDSLVMNPYDGTTYSAYIAGRNNMTLLNKGKSGKKLCTDGTDNPSVVSTYTNDVPDDADFIIVQIGANDVNGWWKRDSELATPVPDTDMTTNTFKGCWNNLLIGLKTYYPNAKLGIILAHNWSDNLGEKSENAITNNLRRSMTQWQKIQCQRLNIPVFDPLEDTRFFTYNLKVYEGAQDADIDSLGLDWYD